MLPRYRRITRDSKNNGAPRFGLHLDSRLDYSALSECCSTIAVRILAPSRYCNVAAFPSTLSFSLYRSIWSSEHGRRIDPSRTIDASPRSPRLRLDSTDAKSLQAQFKSQLREEEWIFKTRRRATCPELSNSSGCLCSNAYRRNDRWSSPTMTQPGAPITNGSSHGMEFCFSFYSSAKISRWKYDSTSAAIYSAIWVSLAVNIIKLLATFFMWIGDFCGTSMRKVFVNKDLFHADYNRPIINYR